MVLGSLFPSGEGWGRCRNSMLTLVAHSNLSGVAHSVVTVHSLILIFRNWRETQTTLL